MTWVRKKREKKRRIFVIVETLNEMLGIILVNSFLHFEVNILIAFKEVTKSDQIRYFPIDEKNKHKTCEKMYANLKLKTPAGCCQKLVIFGEFFTLKL